MGSLPKRNLITLIKRTRHGSYSKMEAGNEIAQKLVSSLRDEGTIIAFELDTDPFG